jgi:hypothetical protein
VQVIIADIDGTVLDVAGRTAACLREIGLEFDDPLAVSRTLRGDDNRRFYELFLGTKYIDLDTPMPRVIEQLRALIEETKLPLIYLSGRLTNVERPTRKALEAIGLPFEALALRPFRYRFKRATEWKVIAIREVGYEPVHIFDDDADVLKALGAAFPEALLHDVSEAPSAPL